MVRKFFKYLEQWEKYEPSSFWFCTIGLSSMVYFSFGALSPASEVPCQSQAVVGQLRSGCQQETTSHIVQITAPRVASSTKAPKPKVFEFTTFNNPQIITLEMLPPNCSNQRATYFVDLVTGNSVYFRIGGKQDGKLWSLDQFKRKDIIEMIKNPNVKMITDISDYHF
jgi:hypothetical protein